MCPLGWFLRYCEKSGLRENEGEERIVETVAFTKPSAFDLRGEEHLLRGIRVSMKCSRKWLSQRVREDLSLGVYNHITKRITLPAKQALSLGWMDEKAWREIEVDGDPREWAKEMEPGSFQLSLALNQAHPPKRTTLCVQGGARFPRCPAFFLRGVRKVPVFAGADSQEGRYSLAQCAPSPRPPLLCSSAGTAMSAAACG